MSSPDDWMSGDPTLGRAMPSAGDLNQLGPNPLTLPLERVSTEASVSAPTSRRGTGRRDTRTTRGRNGGLRTTGYNLAIIAADLADVPTDDGEDRLVR